MSRGGGWTGPLYKPAANFFIRSSLRFPALPEKSVSSTAPGSSTQTGSPAPSKSASQPEPSHFDRSGNARMVDVTAKPATIRQAVATASVWLAEHAVDVVRHGGGRKGDVLAVARIAGINASKQTAHLIPLCHSIPVEAVEIDFQWLDEPPSQRMDDSGQLPVDKANQSGETTAESSGLSTRLVGPVGRQELAVIATVRTTGKTGVEMEALTAATMAALTVYDMVKSVDRAIVIGSVRLQSKTGGKSGEFRHPEAARISGRMKENA